MLVHEVDTVYGALTHASFVSERHLGGSAASLYRGSR